MAPLNLEPQIETLPEFSTVLGIKTQSLGSPMQPRVIPPLPLSAVSICTTPIIGL